MIVKKSPVEVRNSFEVLTPAEEDEIEGQWRHNLSEAASADALMESGEKQER